MARRRYYRSGYDRGYSYQGRYRRERRNEERQVELITFGLVIVLFALQALFLQAINTSLILLLGGMILLGGAFYQSSRRWRVNPMTWIGGAAMLVFGVIGLQTGQVPLDGLLPILIFGGVILASFLTGEF